MGERLSLSRLRTAWIGGQLDGVSIGIGNLFEPPKFLSTRCRTHLDGHLSSGSDDALPQHGFGQSVLRTHMVRREGLDRPRRFNPVLHEIEIDIDVRVDPFDARHHAFHGGGRVLELRRE